MSFVREQDKLARRNQRLVGRFAGVHYGTGKTDQSDEFAYMCDYDCSEGILRLRDGCKKGGVDGWTYGIHALFDMSLFNEEFVGVVQNGVLSLNRTADLLTGRRAYYTWGALLGYTWDELARAEWETLVNGDELP